MVKLAKKKSNEFTLTLEPDVGIIIVLGIREIFAKLEIAGVLSLKAGTVCKGESGTLRFGVRSGI